MHQHVLRRLDVLRRVVRLFTGDALAPALPLVGDRLDKEDVTLELGPERCLERRDERDPNPPQLNRFHLHPRKPAAIAPSRASSSSLSSTSDAATFCSSCSTDEAPRITTTFGLRSSQARATCEEVAWRREAIAHHAASSGV